MLEILYKMGYFITRLYPTPLNNALCDGPDIIYLIFMQEEIVGAEVVILAVLLLFILVRRIKKVSLYPIPSVSQLTRKFEKESAAVQIYDTEEERQNFINARKAISYDKNDNPDYARARLFEEKFPEIAKSLEPQIKEATIKAWMHRQEYLLHCISHAEDIKEKLWDVKSEEEYRNIRGSSETEAGMDWTADVQIICQTLWKSRELISEAVGSDVGAILARFHEDAQRTGNYFIMLREKYEPKPEQNKGHEPWSDGIITSTEDYYSSYSRSYDNDYSYSGNNGNNFGSDNSYSNSNDYSSYNDTSSSYNSSSNNSGGYDNYSDYWHDNNGWSQGLSGNEDEDQWQWQ